MHDHCSNELSALKQSIVRILLRQNSCKNGFKGYIKFLTVDVPFSFEAFTKYFGIHFQNHQRLSEKFGCKVSLPVQELNSILGRNWHIGARKCTTTQQRIIGDISIHYRPKYSAVFDNADCPR